MSKKYHIAIDAAPARYPGVPRYSVLETEGCLGCLKCVKRTSCVYSAYDTRSFDPKAIVDKTDTMCVGCMQCVQDCKKNILSRGKNPRFERMGNDAQELYSAVNIVRRVPPAPLFALLSSRPEFVHVGDLHIRLGESEWTMIEGKRVSIVKPTVDTPFHVDFNSWKKNERDWHVYLRSLLCTDHQQAFADVDEGQTIDWVDPVTAEVKPVEGIQNALMTHCARQPDLLTQQTALVEVRYSGSS